MAGVALVAGLWRQQQAVAVRQDASGTAVQADEVRKILSIHAQLPAVPAHFGQGEELAFGGRLKGSGLVYGTSSTNAKEIGVAVANSGESVEMVSKAASNRCHVLVDNKAPFSSGPTGATGAGTWYG